MLPEGAALGHDEGVYGVRGRDFALGQPRASYFAAYRAPGLPWILGNLPIGVGLGRYRFVVTMFGAFGVAGTWLLGRTVVNRTTGLLAAALLAITPTWLVHSTLVLPDVPGAALGIAALAVFALGLTRPTLPPWTWLVVPLGMAATWVRFGAPLVIGLGMATLALFAWQRVRNQFGHVALLGLAMVAAMGSILLVPAMVGQPTSAATAIREFGADKPNIVLETLSDYAVDGPIGLGDWLGWLVTATLVLGLLAALVVRVRRPWNRTPGPTWAAVTTVLSVLGLSVVLSHGDARYLAPVFPLLWITVAAILTWFGRRVPAPVAVVPLLVLLWAAGGHAFERVELVHARQEEPFDILREIGLRVANDPDLPCETVTSYAPQVEWYSGCDAAIFGDPLPALADERPVTVVVLEGGKRQPDEAALATVVGPRPDVVLDQGGDGVLARARLYGVAPRPETAS